MPALRSAICLALIIVSVLAATVSAADPGRPAAAAPSTPAPRPPVAAYWDDRFDIAFHERWLGSMDAVINDAVIYNGELYVAGKFSDGNPSAAAHVLDVIARWDGRKWTNVSKWSISGFPRIYAMEVHDGDLYVVGDFGMAGNVAATNIARWDGANWHALGSGLGDDSSRVFALASWNGDLYATGSFTTAGGVAASNIARWDGASWHAVGAGLTSEPNNGTAGVALVATPQGLYAGGLFNRSGTQEMTGLARWDGAQWSAVVPGLAGIVYSLDWHNGQLYAGGRLALASAPSQTHNMLRWDGAQAQLMTLGPDPQVIVRMVRSVDGELYAGFTSALYRWEGSAWQPFGPPIKTSPSFPDPMRGMDIIAYNGQLHLVGALEFASTTTLARYAMVLNGDEWLGLGQGVMPRTGDPFEGHSNPSMVSGVAVIDDDFYISAHTIKAGGKLMGNLARWDGSAWHDVHVGPHYARVTALLAAGSTLYAAGYGYDPALGRDSNFIARRDAGVWTSVANDFDGRIDALAWSDGALYAGGRFTAIGAMPARGVARWDGTAWSALGGGLLFNVRALAASGGAVYAIGSTTANNTFPTTIARWHNGSWSAIADAEAYALTVGPDGTLYAGGTFSAIGGIAASRIARWRDGAWEPLGGGVTGSGSPAVFALGFAPDGALYIGGRFRQAGSLAVSNIARYDGQWSALGGGLTGISYGGAVRDLKATAQGVYAAGDIFFLPDGRFSEGVAIWHTPAATNSAPLALADTGATVRGQAVDVAVLANDSDADQDALTITGVTTPTHGSARVVGGTVRYTPAGDFVGTVPFSYTVGDGYGGTASATVTVTIANRNPQASADVAATVRGQAVDVAVLANDTDADQDGLTITGVSAPAHGSAAVVGGTVRYTPAADFVGTDSFSYTVGDGYGGSAGATVSVTITAPPNTIFLPLVVR